MPNLQDNVISLSLELSSRSGSIAVGRGDRLRCVESVHKASRHSDDVMPAVDRAFAQSALSPTELDEVYVSIGPGGFTGIRLAATIAKMLAFATGARILPMLTSDVVAEAVSVAETHGKTGGVAQLLVALASKRGQSWCVRYRAHHEQDDRWWEAIAPGALMRTIECLDTLPAGSIIAADVVDESLREAARARSLQIVEARHEASACFAAARRRIRQALRTSADAIDRLYADPVELVPFYAREPEAVRLWAKRESTDPSARDGSRRGSKEK